MRPDQLRQIPLVIGIRNLIHDQANPDWLVRAGVDEGLTDLERARVSFDLISTLPRHFEHVTGLGERHPGRRVVIGHLSRPPFGEADWEPWWSLIEGAAENSLVSAKVSGVYPASGSPTEWSKKSVRPYFERALEVFGSDRLMHGGNWRISFLAGDYDAVWEGLASLLDELCARDRVAILDGTARQFYRMNDAILERIRRAGVQQIKI